MHEILPFINDAAMKTKFRFKSIYRGRMVHVHKSTTENLDNFPFLSL